MELPTPHRPRLLSLLVLLPVLAASAASASFAAEPLPDAARATIENFVRVQTNGLAGKVSVEIRAPGSTPLPDCNAYEAFLPAGVVPWGRVSMGLRCLGDRPWTRFLPTRVTIQGKYFVAAHEIEAGRPLGANDVVERSGDLTSLPRSVVTDAAVLKGMTSVNRIAEGAPMRKEALRGVVVIQQGQTVQVVAKGEGFVISVEGKAMTRAEAGSTVQAKTVDGRMITGVADMSGQIRLQ